MLMSKHTEQRTAYYRNTGSLKYSASLYENPIGSFNFINPEIINNKPTNILEN
jgi:hypothetical protein